MEVCFSHYLQQFVYQDQVIVVIHISTYMQALQKLAAQFSTKFLPKENDSEAKTMSRLAEHIF